MCCMNFFEAALDSSDPPPHPTKSLTHELKPDAGSGLSHWTFTPRQVRVELSTALPERLLPRLVRGPSWLRYLLSVSDLSGLVQVPPHQKLLKVYKSVLVFRLAVPLGVLFLNITF